MSTEKDREAIETICKDMGIHSAYRFNSSDIFGDNDGVEITPTRLIEAGIQYTRQGERELQKIFVAKFLALALQLGFDGYEQWSSAMVKFLEQEAKNEQR